MVPNTFQLIDADLARNAITRDQAAAYKMYTLFGARDAVPSQYFNAAPVPGDGTMLFVEAMQGWDQLSPQTKTLINDFITPKEITATLPLSLMAPFRTDGATQAARITTPPAFAPGVYHIHGPIVRLLGQQIQVKTERGIISITIQANTSLRLENQSIGLAQLQVDDVVDGFIRVEPNGQISTNQFAVIRMPVSTAQPQAMLQTTSTNPRWSTPTNLAAGLGWSSSPALATDVQNNVYIAWASGATPAGLRLKHNRDVSGSTAQ